jgi:hypothetical protein
MLLARVLVLVDHAACSRCAGTQSLAAAHFCTVVLVRVRCKTDPFFCNNALVVVRRHRRAPARAEQ